MYRENLFYANKQFTLWSATLEGPNKEDFENFSTRFARVCPGYMLDREMLIRPKPNTIVINLKELVKVFRSKDETLWNESQWMFENEVKFLDGEANPSNKIAFASFPRSGNTFLRKYCELLTNVGTGADFYLHTNVIL